MDSARGITSAASGGGATISCSYMDPVRGITSAASGGGATISCSYMDPVRGITSAVSGGGATISCSYMDPVRGINRLHLAEVRLEAMLPTYLTYLYLLPCTFQAVTAVIST
jgi:hypothetical protein